MSLLSVRIVMQLPFCRPIVNSFSFIILCLCLLVNKISSLLLVVLAELEVVSWRKLLVAVGEKNYNLIVTVLIS